MAVTIHAPGTLPLSDATWPFPVDDGNNSNAPSYAYWIVAGGAGDHPPDPAWTCAVADAPAIVESRRDGIQNRELVFTAVGGETSITFTLAHAPVQYTIYLILDTPYPVGITNTAAHANLHNGTAQGNLAVTGNVLSCDAMFYSAGGGIPPASEVFQVGRHVLLGRCNGTPLAAICGAYMRIETFTGADPVYGFTATILSATVADIPSFANGLHSVYFYPLDYRFTGDNAPFTAGDGTINFYTGACSMPCAALTAGQKIYAVYGSTAIGPAVHGLSFGDFFEPWTGTAALVAGSDAATATITPLEYDPNQGVYATKNSEWLVCRGFGFGLPSNAVIRHIAFMWEGSSITTGSDTPGTAKAQTWIENAALLVNNQIPDAPYDSQSGGGDRQANSSNNTYGQLGWPSGDFIFPGSVANDGTHQFASSEDLADLVAATRSVKDFYTPSFLTVNDINSDGFGFAVAAFFGQSDSSTPSTGIGAVSVHSVRMAIYYTPAGGNQVTFTDTVSLADSVVGPSRAARERLDVNYVLQAVSYVLLEKVLLSSFPAPVTVGLNTVALSDPAIYVGAEIIAGNPDLATQEIVVVTAITAATFTAAFRFAHDAGETLRGATFSSGQTNQLSSPNVGAD